MDRSLADLLDTSADRFGPRPAILDGDQVVSYAELRDRADRLAARLLELAPADGRVALILPNLPALPVALYGAWRAGLEVLLMSAANSPRETEEYLEAAGVRTVLTGTALLGLLPAGCRALLLDGLPHSLRLLDEGAERDLPLEASARPRARSGGDDVAALLFTAANRGHARAALLSHRNLLANLRSTVEAMALTADDRMLAALPLVHAFGLTVSLNAAVSAGAAVIPVERFHPLRVLDLLEAQRPTVMAGVPAMYIGLLSAAERRGVPAHALRLAISGGAPLPGEVAERWQATFGLPLRQGYGLTEAAPVCLFNRADRPDQPGTLGYPFPGVEVTIRGPDGEELADGEVGEICVRGENVFLGYLGDGGRDPAEFHGDWLRTGDLGSRRPDGAVRFRGMLKPMFTRNGFNVYPREIERVLAGDPRIEGATVYAQPDPLRENDAVVVVRRRPGAVLTEDDVRELCRARLASYKQPTRVEIL
jgi:long-chain acyl-CoA synthetase